MKNVSRTDDDLCGFTFWLNDGTNIYTRFRKR